MKIGDRVLTADGPGVIVDVEIYSRQGNRYGVKLDSPPEWYCFCKDGVSAYYWEKELKKV